MVEEMKYLIEFIPNYIIFLYPGYITIWLYQFFRGTSPDETKGFLVKIISISYLESTMIKCFLSEIGIFYNLMLVTSAVLAAYISYLIISSEKVQKLLSMFAINTSTHTNEISQLKGFEDSVYLRVYLRNKQIVYEGGLANYEADKEQVRFIILSGYKKYYISYENLNETKLVDYQYKDEEKILIYFEDIERIERCDLKRIEEEYLQTQEDTIKKPIRP